MAQSNPKEKGKPEPKTDGQVMKEAVQEIAAAKDSVKTNGQVIKETKREIRETKEEMKETKEEVKEAKEEMKEATEEVKESKEEVKEATQEVKESKEAIMAAKKELKQATAEMKEAVLVQKKKAERDRIALALEVEREIANRVITVMTTALAVVAGLFWQTAINDTIKTFIPVGGAWQYEVAVAAAVTLGAAVTIYILSKSTTEVQKKLEQPK